MYSDEIYNDVCLIFNYVDQTKIRISRCLAKAGLASRRQAEQLILDGRVTLNGNIVSEPWRSTTTDI